MLKIRVLGSGLIPRIGTLAPKKEPFLADANLIQIILYQDLICRMTLLKLK